MATTSHERMRRDAGVEITVRVGRPVWHFDEVSLFNSVNRSAQGELC